MNKRPITLAITGLLLLGACSHSHPATPFTAGSPTTARTQQAGVATPASASGVDTRKDLPPISKYFDIESCPSVEQFVGTLRYLPTTPPGDRVVCFLEGSDFGLRPDKTTGVRWSAGVFYVPPGMSIDKKNFLDVEEGGGVLIELTFHETIQPTQRDLTTDNATQTHGLVNGHPAFAGRQTPARVTVNWYELGPDGSPMFVTIIGGFTLASALDTARSLAVGLPTPAPSPPIATAPGTTTTMAPTSTTTPSGTTS